MRRLLAFLFAALIAWPALAITPAQRGVVFGGGYGPDALAYFNQLAANGCPAPGTFFKRAVSDYIRAEKAAGNWGSQDFAYITMFSACIAKTNLVQPALYTITWSGTCTFTIPNGQDGNGTDCSGDTNVAQNALVFATQNNSRIEVCANSSGTNVGGVGAVGTFQISAAANKVTRLSSSAGFTDTGGGGAGCHFAWRTGSGNITTGKNGVVQSSATANSSTAPAATHTGICQSNASFCGATHNFFIGIGAPIADEPAHYANVRKMLVVLGAQGI